MNRVDYLTLPLVFAGLHVTRYGMALAARNQSQKCTLQEDADLACAKGLDNQARIITYLLRAATIVGALWVVRHLGYRGMSIGSAALMIPILFFGNEYLADCVTTDKGSSSCAPQALLKDLIFEPALWGAVGYCVLQLTHRL